MWKEKKILSRGSFVWGGDPIFWEKEGGQTQIPGDEERKT